jgi:hypothetical protein
VSAVHAGYDNANVRFRRLFGRLLISAALGVVLIASCALLAGCITISTSGNGGGGGKETTTDSTDKPDLTTAEGVAQEASDLVAQMEKVKEIGAVGGQTGWQMIPAVDEVTGSMQQGLADIAQAQKDLASDDSAEAKDASKRLLTLKAAVDKCNESLILARIVAVSEEPVDQANKGFESSSNAVDKANDSDYKGAASSAKDARSTLTDAQTKFAQLAGQYPGAGFDSDVAYCKASIQYSDMAIDLANFGKDNRISAYNEIVGKINKKKNAILKMTSPVARWNQINADNSRTYDESIAALQAVAGGSQ